MPQPMWEDYPNDTVLPYHIGLFVLERVTVPNLIEKLADEALDRLDKEIMS